MEKLTRMRLERDNPESPATGLRGAPRFANNRLMAAMYAVEIPDSHHGAAKIGLYGC
jgi:hypothetical protein